MLANALRYRQSPIDKPVIRRWPDRGYVLVGGLVFQIAAGVLAGVVGGAILSVFKPLSARRFDPVNIMWFLAVTVSVAGAVVFFALMTFPFGIMLKSNLLPQSRALFAIISMYAAIAAFSGYLSAMIYDLVMKKVLVNR